MQQYCCNFFQDVCENTPLVLKSLAKILHYLYDELEILTEEVILDWYKAPPGEGTANKRLVQEDVQVTQVTHPLSTLLFSKHSSM